MIQEFRNHLEDFFYGLESNVSLYFVHVTAEVINAQATRLGLLEKQRLLKIVDKEIITYKRL